MTQPMYYKKEKMLEATEKNKQPPESYVMYMDANEKHRFTYFKKFEDLFKKINKLEHDGRYYVHEIVQNNQKRKPYLDLEKKFDDEKTMKKNFVSIVKKLQSDIIKIFKTEYKETITIDDILLLNSSGKSDGKWKLSLHIIVSPKNKTYYYTNSKHTDSSAFHFCTALLTLDPNYEGLLDKQVYSTNLNFRIIGSYKSFGDDRYLHPIDPRTLKAINLNKEEDNSKEEEQDTSDEEDNSSEAEEDNSSEAEEDNSSEVEEDNSSEEEDNSKEEEDNSKEEEDNSSEAEEDNSSEVEEDNSSEVEENITYEELDYLLTYIKPMSKKLITPKIEQVTRPKTIISLNAPTRTDVSEYLIECVKKYHPSAKFNGTYQGVYHNFNYENRKEPCPISGKVHGSKNGFFVFENERGYYMKCFSDTCKEKCKHIGYADVTDDFIDNAYQINQKYLIMGEKIKDNDEKMCKYIREWLNTEDNKTLAVKSPMATGKTTMVEKILEYDKSISKILWITHRQSLTKQIYGKFKEMGFVNYMDVDGALKGYDRIVVQIDSLERIREITDDGMVYNIYDLVIIDEIEGNMNHYNSPYINKPGRSSKDLFKFMIECVNHAKKILVIDADIGMRTKLFIDYFGKSIIVNNNHKPMKKIFTITNNEKIFNEKMFKDIENKLNVCIVSMSSTALEKIETKLKEDKINYVMHTSKTDDKLKNELENIGEFWIQYQVVLYSPTIESGVDFNEDHFDKIYCIMRDGQMTCSQRSVLQMIGRIRQVRDSNILCHYNGSNKLNAMIYTYDDVLSYFRYYESLNGKKIIEDIQYEIEIDNKVVKTKRKKKDISLFDHISIYNEVEQLNKHRDIFLTVLNKLIQRGGHELKINMFIEPKKGDLEAEDMAEILAEIDETKYNMQQLIGKQKRNKLTSKEKLVLKKMFFNKTFGIKNTKNKEEFITFFDKYSDKEIILRRFEKIFRYAANYNDDENYDNFNDGKNKVRHRIIFDLINRLLEKNDEFYESDELIDIKIDNDQYVRAIKDIAKKSIYFKNEKKNRALFFKSKGILKPINDQNQIYYMRVIQLLLKNYGIYLVANGRERINGVQKYIYSLSADKQIKNIVEFKHNVYEKINIYKKLFKSD